MNDPTTAALLPAGLMDVLPPLAAFEAAAVERLVAAFAGWGYERIKPPLIEYEETMLAGPGAALVGNTFRLMDPASQRMLALRSDMTTQVARIAASRLAHWPRPLRLSYAGQVMRVRGSQLRPERQFGQVGAELFGSSAPAADVELIVMAAGGLADLGVRRLSVDLGVPTLVPAIVAAASGSPAVADPLRAALDRKDAAVIAALAAGLGHDVARTLSTLAVCTGPAPSALQALFALDLPEGARAQIEALGQVCDGLGRAAPNLGLTIDPLESRGFEYHSGVTFTLFAAAAAGELGRGGRYGSDAGEPATGITLFMDAVLRTLPRPERRPRVYVPTSAPADVCARLRAQGWITVAALDAVVGEAVAAAAKLGCSHVYADGTVDPIAADRHCREEN